MIDFFKELAILQAKTPRVGSIRLNPVNSEYTHNTDHCKNCYLIANAVKNQDCMYGRDFYNDTDCVDCDHTLDCTLCYECLNCKNCYQSTYLQDCENCRDCTYGYDLKSCTNCIGCTGLRKKEYHIFNEPYSPEEFARKKASLTPNEIMQTFVKLKESTPRRWADIIGSEHSIGDYIHNSKNAFASFDIIECQDVGYVSESKKVKDSWDIFVLEDAELCYDCSSNHILHNSNFCFMCASSSNLEYCELVFNSKDCFGCISLNHKQYQILNTPYAKEAYFKTLATLKDQLKKEGTYGRQYLSTTHPYQDTVASWERL